MDPILESAKQFLKQKQLNKEFEQINEAINQIETQLDEIFKGIGSTPNFNPFSKRQTTTNDPKEKQNKERNAIQKTLALGNSAIDILKEIPKDSPKYKEIKEIIKTIQDTIKNLRIRGTSSGTFLALDKEEQEWKRRVAAIA